MWLKLKMFLGYAILVLLLAFIVWLFRQEQMQTHIAQEGKGVNNNIPFGKKELY